MLSINAVLVIYFLTVVGATLASRYHRKTHLWYVGLLGVFLSTGVFVFLMIVDIKTHFL